MYKPKEDGITHINIYSQGKTQLGRFLSNFEYSPIETEDGNFDSIEGYWYWLSCKDDKLRKLSGYKAKEYGRYVGAKDWLEDDEFKRKIKLAISIKINNNKKFLLELQQCKLPFDHYYVYGTKVVNMYNKNKWVVDYIESFKIP